jgi:hypothetical protein
MEFIYIRREGDIEILQEKIKVFQSYTDEELTEAYNQQAKCGITGVHSQALYLMSLGHVFLKRFGKSPIYLKSNVLGMHGQIKLSGDSFEYK